VQFFTKGDNIRQRPKPRFVCTSCGRVANKKKNLCSPERIKEK
jgi:hypothetical protein